MPRKHSPICWWLKRHTNRLNYFVHTFWCFTKMTSATQSVHFRWWNASTLTSAVLMIRYPGIGQENAFVTEIQIEILWLYPEPRNLYVKWYKNFCLKSESFPFIFNCKITKTVLIFTDCISQVQEVTWRYCTYLMLHLKYVHGHIWGQAITLYMLFLYSLYIIYSFKGPHTTRTFLLLWG